MSKNNNRTKVYSSKKITLTEKEKADLDYKLQKERDKFDRDAKCGGIDEVGNFTRLHDRWDG